MKEIHLIFREFREDFARTWALYALDGARGRNRTGTETKLRGILSPLRLPIPPPGHATDGWLF